MIEVCGVRLGRGNVHQFAGQLEPMTSSPTLAIPFGAPAANFSTGTGVGAAAQDVRRLPHRSGTCAKQQRFVPGKRIEEPSQ